MGRAVGIDLGTTNSVVAIVDQGRPKVLINRSRKPMTRSAVSLRRGPGQGYEVLVGDAAADNWPSAPQDTVVSVKRLMGRAITDEQVQKVRQWAQYSIVEPSDGTQDGVRVVLGGREYSPVEISAKILRKLKEDAEIRLQEKITHAVITVPAYFSEIQRAATRAAGLQAGLHVIKILEEPTAAAIAFGVDAQVSSEPKYLLVYDLGGGTFDISLLMWSGGVFMPLVLEGDMWLGGDDFDHLIAARVLEQIESEHGFDGRVDKAFMVALKTAAQRAKELLSTDESVSVSISDVLLDPQGKPVTVRLDITRAEFEKMISPQVDRTIDLARRAIDNYKLTCDEIDCVLLVGNSTRIPMIQRAMEGLFGVEKIKRDVHPKHSVAIGAAILAHRLGEAICQAPDPADGTRECGHVNSLGAVVCAKCGAPLAPEGTREPGDTGHVPRVSVPAGIAPFAYGTQTAGDVFNVFIDEGDPYPTRDPQTQTFHTLHPNQRMISIPVYGGDHLEKASANAKQGEAFAVLPAYLPKGTPVRVTVWLNDNGCFQVGACLDDGTDLVPWITEGGEDAKAIEIIETAWERLVQQESCLPVEHVLETEFAIQQALEKLKSHDFSDALAMARQAEDIVGRAARAGATETLPDKAARLVDYAQFLVHQYPWALDSNDRVALTHLADETQEVLKAQETDLLNQKARELDELTDRVPRFIMLLLAVKLRIVEGILPVDLALARRYMNEVEQVEAQQSSDPAAEAKMEDIWARVYRDMHRLQSLVARCGVCGGALEAARLCPHCGQDQLALDNKKRRAGNLSF